MILRKAYEKSSLIFGPDEPFMWNSTYMMLQEVIGNKEVLSTWLIKEMSGIFPEEQD